MARPAVIVLVLGLAYANSVSGPFIWDDQLTVLTNDSIREWRRLSAVLAPERELPIAGRPLVNASFAINYALGGHGTCGPRTRGQSWQCSHARRAWHARNRWSRLR